MSIVNLVSGGLDSTLMAVLAKEEGVVQYPLFINYGQICARMEWKACQAVHRQHRLPQPVYMDINGFGEIIPSGLTNRSLRVNEDAFLPGRNLLFLLVGASYAYSVKASGVSIGLLSEKYRIFPDQTTTFLKSSEELLKSAMGFNLRIMAPLMEFSKQDVLTLAKQKNIQGTYSCHTGKAVPCGHCVSCMEFKKTDITRR